MAVMVRAGLGLDPWDVFHQGLAGRTGMTIGIASAVVGVAVLLAWIPLRNRPGIGTVANVDRHRRHGGCRHWRCCPRHRRCRCGSR